MVLGGVPYCGLEGSADGLMGAGIADGERSVTCGCWGGRVVCGY